MSHPSVTAPSSIEVRFQCLHPVLEEHPPVYATCGSAGVDLRACIDEPELHIASSERVAIPTGLAIEITTPQVAGFIYSRSGLGTKEGLVVSQGVGVIDPDYRGQLIVSLLNTSQHTRTVERGQRIAQLVLQPVYHAAFVAVEKIAATDRGTGGFGHTGKH